MANRTRTLWSLLTLVPLMAGCMVPPHFDPGGYSATYEKHLETAGTGPGSTVVVTPEQSLILVVPSTPGDGQH